MPKQALHVHPQDIIAHMKKTAATWPEFASWLNKHKRRKEPMSLAYIMADSENAEFVFQAARALPKDTEHRGRKLAVAIALGCNSQLADVVLADTKLGKGYQGLMDACLARAGDQISAEELWNIREEFAWLARNAYPLKVRACAEAMIGAAAPFSWGGAAIAHRRVFDALAVIHTRTTKMLADPADTAATKGKPSHKNVRVAKHLEFKLELHLARLREEQYQMRLLQVV